jgi:quercetin dioxygenase-like cupin family protein
MQKLVVVAVSTSIVAGAAFLAGVAVGKAPPPQPRFVAAEEVKWDDMNGVKLGQLSGDYKKGPYGALVKLPAGYTSPLHSHTGAYEAVQISGTSSHWMRGEDGTKAKKMTPGSYWSIPAKTEHVSSCAAGTDCVLYFWQKTKFDLLPAKDVAPTGSGSATAATGSGATKPAAATAGTGSAAKPAGAGTGSAAKPPAAGATAVPPTGTAPKPSTGTGSAAAPKK